MISVIPGDPYGGTVATSPFSAFHSASPRHTPCFSVRGARPSPARTRGDDPRQHQFDKCKRRMVRSSHIHDVLPGKRSAKVGFALPGAILRRLATAVSRRHRSAATSGFAAARTATISKRLWLLRQAAQPPQKKHLVIVIAGNLYIRGAAHKGAFHRCGSELVHTAANGSGELRSDARSPSQCRKVSV